jgi:hypothetical protein
MWGRFGGVKILTLPSLSKITKNVISEREARV